MAEMSNITNGINENFRAKGTSRINKASRANRANNNEQIDQIGQGWQIEYIE